MALKRLYPNHLPTGTFSRLVLTAGSGLGAFMFPQRADLVAAFGELTGADAFKRIHERMQQDPTGQLLLREKPIVTDVFLDSCKRAPAHSFGRAYADYMGARRFAADERPPVRFIDDPEVAYVATRYRQVHDFWHVLFDCHTNLLGEAALKAVEFSQTGLPMTALSIVAGQAKLKPDQQVLLTTQLLPWAVRAGSRCHDLMCLYYETHVDEDLEELRNRWRILVAPKFIEAQKKSAMRSERPPS